VCVFFCSKGVRKSKRPGKETRRGDCPVHTHTHMYTFLVCLFILRAVPSSAPSKSDSGIETRVLESSAQRLGKHLARQGAVYMGSFRDHLCALLPDILFFAKETRCLQPCLYISCTGQAHRVSPLPLAFLVATHAKLFLPQFFSKCK
jgi:hypothetical protein